MRAVGPARRSSLWIYPGKGNGTFAIRSASNAFYLYPGTGKATSEIFGTPKSLGSGFRQYDICG